MKALRSIVAACVVLLLVGAVSAAEMVDNPQYVSWSKQKPGTKIIQQNQMTAQGVAMSQDITQTLIAVTPEKATVEIAVTMEMMGQKHEQKQKQDIAAKVEKGKEYLAADAQGTVKSLGKESLSIGGKDYECEVIEVSGENKQGKFTGKLWNSLQVPGNLAKMEMSMGSPASTTTKLTVTQIEQK